MYNKNVLNFIDGFDVFSLPYLFEKITGLKIVILEDMTLADKVCSNIKFVYPNIDIQIYPEWDCFCYDVNSPSVEISAQRTRVLSELVFDENINEKIIITTINALANYTLHKSFIHDNVINFNVGCEYDIGDLALKLSSLGYINRQNTREEGDFSIRGGVVDVYPFCFEKPIRIDFFGDEVESIKYFDEISQKTFENIKQVRIPIASEIILNEKSINLFKSRYKKFFGSVCLNDEIINSVSGGIFHQSIYHFLPYFHEKMSTFFDYIPNNSNIFFFENYKFNIKNYYDDLNFYYNTRFENINNKAENTMRPIPINELYLPVVELEKNIESYTSFDVSKLIRNEENLNIEFSLTRVDDFTNERVSGENIVNKIRDLCKSVNKKIIIMFASYDKLLQFQKYYDEAVIIDNINDAKIKKISICLNEIDEGFSTDEYYILSEKDVFGVQTSRRRRKKKDIDVFLNEMSSLEVGDYLVHDDHGVGQFLGVEKLEANGFEYECIKLAYDGGSFLYVSIENMDVLSLYGNGNSDTVVLDKLGSESWSSKKNKLKKNLFEIADKIVETEAQRQISNGEIMLIDTEDYDKFKSGFSYVETDDQQNAIDDVMIDLQSGKMMDRLVCGDVGFGKTEVAMRATYVVASNGFQVFIVCPTTILARQHYENFIKRFEGFDFKIREYSRLSKNRTLVKKEIENGDALIIVGTHGLLSDAVNPSNIGLLIIDEEQSFGVKQKEGLKEKKSTMHVLSMSATPIPRTLQMSISGVRSLSIISTPPVDKIPVKIFSSKYEKQLLKEVIQREISRGGQVFVVSPRVRFIDNLEKDILSVIPNLRLGVAYGSLPVKEIDDVMTKFKNGSLDVLLSTNIIESGIDIQNANTMVIYNADILGLSQIYQLCGRVGRGNKKSYCYLMQQRDKILTKSGKKRLQIMQKLNKLNSGFSVASYDLDMRGSGNVLGDDQSGHIKQIGVEMYQSMLRDAILKKKQGDKNQLRSSHCMVMLPVPVHINENYINDSNIRISYYRKISRVETVEELEDLKLELLERYGVLDGSIENLFKVANIKLFGKMLNISKIDMKKTTFIYFENNKFKNPDALIDYVFKSRGAVKFVDSSSLEVVLIKNNLEEKLDEIINLLNILLSMIESKHEQ